ncbi:MAG: acyltransferase [Nocardioides sp.]
MTTDSHIAGTSPLTLPEDCSTAVPVVSDGAGSVSVGRNTHFGYSGAPLIGDGSVRLHARYEGSRIGIGQDCEFSNNISIVALGLVSIGNGCLIGNEVLIFDSDFHDVAPELRADLARRSWSDGKVGSVVIGDNVWLGARSMLLRGSVIGDGSVIAAGSVVRGEFPDRSLVAGVPASLIRNL